ncbi:unnamed protein product [Blepharisma stoltei]|uniref:Cyclin-like domain-containing protein n=1 Tax=Blepharisma stoltei TaxID=1481888 RepID=A0AAU9KFK2_9CILI|nr:unnamed protein product [Blepharisma stoltei]
MSRKYNQAYENNIDSLNFLLSREREKPPLGDFLSGNDIQASMRDKLVQWMFKLSQDLSLQLETTQFAISLMDLFLSKVKTAKSVIQLLGVVCLMISTKFNENRLFTLQDALFHTGKQYKINEVQLTEVFILHKLEWRLNITTASELVRRLFILTGLENDFSRIYERIDAFTCVCYGNYELSQYRVLEIAIASSICTLEQFNQINFRNQWVQLLFNQGILDVGSVDLCKRTLLRVLYSQTSPYDAHKLSPITLDSIETYIRRNNDEKSRLINNA